MITLRLIALMQIPVRLIELTLLILSPLTLYPEHYILITFERDQTELDYSELCQSKYDDSGLDYFETDHAERLIHKPDHTNLLL